MNEIENIGMIAETTAKFMDTLEREMTEVRGPVAVKHVCVIAEMDYIDEDGDRANHVILETDEDSRILQIGITNAAANAAMYGSPVGGDDE